MLFAVDQIVVYKTEGSLQTDLYQLNLERKKNNVVIFKQKTIVDIKRVHTIETKVRNNKQPTEHASHNMKLLSRRQRRNVIRLIN